MNDNIKRMDVKEFREMGLLAEVNRTFFHPLGLALEVSVEDDGTESLGGIWDYREDPEGILYSEKNFPDERIKKPRNLSNRSMNKELKYWDLPFRDRLEANLMNDFESKFTVAILLFAKSLQKVMERDELSECVAKKYEENQNISVEDLQKEIAVAAINGLSKEYKIGGENNE